MIYTTPTYTFLKQPPPPIWKATLVNGVVWNQPGDKPAPNAFYRFMQRLAFGIRWERIHYPSQPKTP